MNKFIEGFDAQFAGLHRESHKLIETIAPELLYHQPPGKSNSLPLHSCGEHLLRSAAVVEQTCGGITANLWDDPFEWTLPETLTTPESIVKYLGEVETTRRRAFTSLGSDTDLLKDLAMPSGEVQSLARLFLETLTRANQFHGQAILMAKILSAGNTSRFII